MGKPASRRAPKSRKAAPSPAVASVSKPPGLKVLFVSSEVTPFAKTGGLADVESRNNIFPHIDYHIYAS